MRSRTSRMSGIIPRSFLFVAVALIVAISLCTSNAHSAQATLAWDPPVNADVTEISGYRIHYGTMSGSYTENIDVGNVTTYTIAGLTDGATYYFAASDYDAAGNESSFSNEVSKAFPAPTPAPTPPPTPVPAPSTYLITATSGKGGSITPLGNTAVNTASNQTNTVSSIAVAPGATLSLAITAATGYQIADVVVDGVSKGKISSYTFDRVALDHTISATFAQPPSAKGDVDGDGKVGAADAMAALRAVIGATTLTADQTTRADVWPIDASGTPAGDGTIVMADVIIILRRAIGLSTW